MNYSIINSGSDGNGMIVEDTKDLVETADCVIIEAVLVDDGLRNKQLSVGIKAKNGDIIRIIPISTKLM